MKVYQITEFDIMPGTVAAGSTAAGVIGKLSGLDITPGPGKFNYVKLPGEGGKYAINYPDGTRYGIVDNKAKAASGSIALNTEAQKIVKAQGVSFDDAVKSEKFKSRSARFSKSSNIGIKPIADLDPKDLGPKSVGKTVVNTAKGTGMKILGLLKNTLTGNVIFGILAVKDIADDLDGWAQVYMDNGCNLNDKRLDAYELKIRKTILENIAFWVTGASLASAGIIRTLSLFLMALPVAGWIATALAWVGAGVLANMIAKLLSSTKVANWIADYVIGSMIGPETIKMLSFPNCPNESMRESWEARINEDIKVFMEKREIKQKAALKGAADAIKDVFKSDKQLMKVLKVTKNKVDSGEVDKISKGGKSAVKQALTQESFREAIRETRAKAF
jgi:hypothetical protein